MTRIRLLVWLLALVALIAPPGLSAHAMAAATRTSSLHCPDHAPPPDPCPGEGTAKHAAGACCPLMAGAVALLPPPASVDKRIHFHAPAPGIVRSLVGRLFTKDPPPPRV